MTSVVRGSDNFDSALGAALKAWVNFDGSGTVSIDASSNVTSITDNGTGDYTINFTNAFADQGYSLCCSAQNNANGTSGGERNVSISATGGLQTTSARVIVKDGGGNSADSITVCAAAFR